ncbi:MAG TPA: hypothetical protein VNU68_21300 [Verrucomicrobiae bacterium]|nr:hypothetical protein [Verrucomicrobiae bacterium]
MSLKHTPDPWIIVDDHENENSAVVVDSATESWQIAGPCPRDNERGMADMRLIVSAPHLLRTLERVRYLLGVESDTRGQILPGIKKERMLSPELEECREIVRSAIAKVEG